MNEDPIRVLVADDHEVVRAGVRSLMAAHPDIEVVGQAVDGPSAVSAAERLKPDVLTLDLSMPDSVATQVIPAVLAASPKTAVLVLTMHDDPLYAHSSVSAGAKGYLVKSAASAILIDAVRALARGEQFLDPAVQDGRTLSAPPSARTRADGQRAGAPVRLSPREREVLILLARGHTHREVADKLSVGINSVGTYRNRMSKKLGLETRADVLRYAVQEGLLAP